MFKKVALEQLVRDCIHCEANDRPLLLRLGSPWVVVMDPNEEGIDEVGNKLTVHVIEAFLDVVEIQDCDPYCVV